MPDRCSAESGEKHRRAGLPVERQIRPPRCCSAAEPQPNWHQILQEGAEGTEKAFPRMTRIRIVAHEKHESRRGDGCPRIGANEREWGRRNLQPGTRNSEPETTDLLAHETHERHESRTGNF